MVEAATTPRPGIELTPRVLRRWREGLGGGHPRAVLDAFVRRHQATLEDMVACELVRRAEAGRKPTGAHAFAAYMGVVLRERGVDALDDHDLIERLSALIQPDFAKGLYTEISVLSNLGREYVLTRAEAMFLRHRGWDPVPLLVDSPALAFIIGGNVIAVRTSMGHLAIHPERRGTINHLYADVRRAEEAVENLLDEIVLDYNTKERLIRFAYAIWDATRSKIAARQI